MAQTKIRFEQLLDIPYSKTLFLATPDSDISTYDTLSEDAPSGGGVSAPTISITGDTVVKAFAAKPGAIKFIEAQVCFAYVALYKVGGTKSLQGFVELYHRTSGGTETLIGTSQYSPVLTTSVLRECEFRIEISTYKTFATTDRLVVKIVGHQSGSGTDPTMTFNYGGASTSFARVSLSAVVPTREVLTDDRTYYVRTDGSDSNTGLTNSSGGAFLTIQKAVDVVAALDLSIYDVIIQVADGTYTTPIVVSGPWVGLGTVTIKGNVSTPANVLLHTTSADVLQTANHASIAIESCELRTTTTGNGLMALTASTIYFSNIRFGAIVLNQIQANDNAAIIATGNYFITGNCSIHMTALKGGILDIRGRTVNVAASLTFSYFAAATRIGILMVNNNTYTGSTPTCTRYIVATNSLIDTNGGGASYFPGTVAGSTATGGQYV